MYLADILKLKFPDADFLDEIKLRDDGDGVYICEWNRLEPQPTKKDIEKWAVELEQEYQYQQNKIINKTIYDQLMDIDFKSIRAIREGDQQRISDLESQAASLRAQLLPVG